MAQQIEAVITIPETMVLVTKVEYEQLKELENFGDTLTLNEFSNRLNRSTVWVKDNVLKNPKFRRKIDLQNGGFVYYPQGGSDSYVFLKTKALDFIENNLAEIMKK